MSYYLYDVNGYVGDLASNRGLRDLMDYFDSEGGKALKELAEKGTAAVGAVSKELGSLADPSDKTVKATIENLKKLVSKSKNIIIITDGIFDGTDLKGKK